MATQPASKLSKDERKTLEQGLDAIIASTSRSTARETDPEVVKLREKRIQQLVALKNKLATLELEL